MISRLLKILSSLRLTVALLALGILIIFLGTLAQVHEGTWNAQKLYFQSWFVVNPLLYFRRWPIVLPGGYLIGTVLLVNLVLAHFKGANWAQRNVRQVLAHHGVVLPLVFLATWVAVRSPFVGMGLFGMILAGDLWMSRAGPLRDSYSGKKLGINFTHVGVVMLLLGQLATDQLAVETHLRFREGETRGYTESHRQNELVFITDEGTDREQVIAIPERIIAQKAEVRHEKLPFVVRVKDYGPNGRVRARGPMVDTGAPPATRGDGTRVVLEPLPEVKDEEHRNLPYAVLEVEYQGASLGTWLAAEEFLDEQEIKAGKETWRMTFRLRREYTPFTVQLLKTTHEVYPGTDRPRNFQSRVRIENAQAGENRETAIYMNHPLRYAGLTFYQSGMIEKGRMDAGEIPWSDLQVVRNPTWLTPYIGCGTVGYGLARHFLFYLIAFILKRRTA
ncbi:MAG: hypothetical protein QOF48_1146 [Verrucomicrobiota bacterium]|jgi:hypothetical protein